RQREALRELERRALLPVHEPALRHVLLALAAQREDVLVDGELDVLLAEPRQIGLEHEGLPGVVEREPREAAAPEALGVAHAGTSGLELLPDAIHAAAQVIHRGHGAIEVIETADHGLLPSGAERPR